MPTHYYIQTKDFLKCRELKGVLKPLPQQCAFAQLYFSSEQGADAAACHEMDQSMKQTI